MSQRKVLVILIWQNKMIAFAFSLTMFQENGQKSQGDFRAIEWLGFFLLQRPFDYRTDKIIIATQYNVVF